MRKAKKKDFYMLLIGVFLFLGIGYAFLTTDLSINGTATTISNSWNIHFDNLVVQNGSVPIGTGDTAASITSPTTISFAVTLPHPKDYYEFLVDIVNEGTLPGVISSIEVTPATALNSNIFGYQYTYTNGKNVKVGDIVDPSDSKTTKFRVFYNDDIDEDDLPDTDVQQNITVAITFEQSDHVEKKACTYNGTLTQGAEFVDGQYTYRYMQEYYYTRWNDMTLDGWGVILTDKNSIDPVTTQMCASINGKPIVSGQSMFLGSKTSNIDLSKLYTSDMINMQRMFRAISIPVFDSSLIDTSSAVDMLGMFGLSSFDTIDLSHLDTSNVTNMFEMFSSLNTDTLDLTNLDTSKVTDMSGMFTMSSINHLNISGLGGDALLDMSRMFQQAEIGDLNISNFRTPNITNMKSMFYSSDIPINLDLSSFDTSKVTNMNSMFDYTTFLTIDISNFNTSNVTNFTGMFWECPNLTMIYVGSTFSTASMTDGVLFDNAPNLVGGQGTVCSGSPDDSYARIDNPPDAPGCFTAKS